MEAAGFPAPRQLQPPLPQPFHVREESSSAGGVGPGCWEAGGPGGLARRERPRPTLAAAAAAELVGPAGVPGDRFAAGWGLGGCWAGCSRAGRVGGRSWRRGESWRSHGEGTQVLRLRLAPGLGLGFGLGLGLEEGFAEEGFAEVGLAAPLPAAWRGCQVGGEEGFSKSIRVSGKEPRT